MNRDPGNSDFATIAMLCAAGLVLFLLLLAVMMRA
jgi:hypothetical protein